MKIIQTILICLLTLGFTSVSALGIGIDQKNSQVTWEGGKQFILEYKHNGTIGIKEATLEERNGIPTGGMIVIDMNAIQNIDIEKEDKRNDLVGHLKSPEFFDSKKYPTATLKFQKITKVTANQFKATTQITIKGKEKTIDFLFKKTKNIYHGNFSINRADFGVEYGSRSFIKNLIDKNVIKNEIAIGFRIVTKSAS